MSTYDFIFEVTVTAADPTFTIPCGDNGTFNATVDWGDTTTSDITSYDDVDLAHTYPATDATYEVHVSGTFPNIKFNALGDCLKVTKVIQLGDVGWTTLDSAFWGCTNMTQFTAGSCDVSGVSSMRSMLRNCSGLVAPPDFSGFVTTSLTNLAYFMSFCTGMTSAPNLSMFNTSQVTVMTEMMRAWTSCTIGDIGVKDFSLSALTACSSFANASTFTTAAYDDILVQWADEVATHSKTGFAFDFGSSTYTLGSAADTARAAIIAAGNTITDGGGVAGSGPSISDASTVRAGETVTLTASFDTVSSVTYGGIALTDIVEATAATITATLPLGGLELGANHDFVITDANGTSAGFPAPLLPRTGYDYFTLTADASAFDAGTAFYNITAVAGDQVEYKINLQPANVNITAVDPATGVPTLDGVVDVESTSDWYVWDASDSYSVGSVGTTTWALDAVVANPVIAPASGVYVDSVEVSISTTTPGATIYYTTDGTDPDTGSAVYSAPFTLSSNAIVKAYATLTDYADSAIVTEAFTVAPQVATPTIAPASGSYDVSATITLDCATPGATIYYTTDGSDPDAESSLYSGPFVITADATVKAVAVLQGYIDSAIQSAAFTIVPPVAVPSFDPVSSVFDVSVEITLACATPGATLYYTDDGSVPDTGSTQYSAPFTVSATTQVKVLAVAAGYVDTLAAKTYYLRGATSGGQLTGKLKGRVTGKLVGRLTGS